MKDRNSFKKEVSEAKGMVLVNFWAFWSKECSIMYAIMRDIGTLVDQQDAIIYIDWERQKRLALELEVFGVPTLLIYMNGMEMTRYSGIISKEDLINRIIVKVL